MASNTKVWRVCVVFNSKTTEKAQRPSHVFSSLSSVSNKGVVNGKLYRFLLLFCLFVLIPFICVDWNWWNCIFCSYFVLFIHVFLLESLESPELPVFYTPGFKLEKHRVPSSPQMDSPPRQNCPSTPDVPAFETPFFSKLLKKVIRPFTLTGHFISYTLLCLQICLRCIDFTRCWKHSILTWLHHTVTADLWGPVLLHLNSWLFSSFSSRV